MPLQAVKEPDVDQNFRSLGDDLSALPLRFLGLANGGAAKVNFGSTEITYPGGSAATTPLEITHGLGTTPVFAGAVAGHSSVNMATTAVGSTKFTVVGENVSGTLVAEGTKTKIYWLAIG